MHGGTLTAGLILLLVWQAAAVEVVVRNLVIDAGLAHNWQVTSSLRSSRNVTLYGNDTSTAVFDVVAKRVSAGVGYTISGRVVISNDQPRPIPVESVRLMLGPGLPFLGPTPKVLDCRPRRLQPGASMSCPFEMQFSSKSTTSITTTVSFGERRYHTGEPLNIEYPEPAADGSECALIRDRVVAGNADVRLSAVGTTADAAALLSRGVEVCDETASWTYSVQLGPFDGSDVCGPLEFKNVPEVLVRSFGSSSVQAATGSLLISGCRQKDALGLLKPTISISKLTLGNLGDTSWTVTTSSSSVTPGVSLDAIPYNTSVAVKSILHINKTTANTVTGVVGEVTLTNNQVVPYVIAGVRVLITPDLSGTAGSAEASEPQQVILDADCPSSPQGAIIIPPQLITSIPAVLKCTFTLADRNSTLQKGSAQAQLRTIFSSTYEVDSGPPVPFDLTSSTATTAAAPSSPSACVEVWAKRVTDAAEVQAADMDVNPTLTAVLGTLAQPGFRFAAASNRLLYGRLPPAPGSLLAIPYQVCGNESIEWVEAYGPFSSDTCGVSLSVLSVQLKPASGKSAVVNTALSVPLTVTGCGVLPQVSVEEVALTAKKVLTWNVATTQATPKLTVAYDNQVLAQYNVSYTRDYSIGGRKLQALVKVINPLSVPVSIQKVKYSISRPEGQAPLTGIAVCNESFAGAAQAAMEASTAAAFASIGAQTGQAVDTISGTRNGVTSFTLPAAPKAVHAVEQPPAPPPPPKAPSRLRFFNFDVSITREDKDTTDSAVDRTDIDSEDSRYSMFFGSDTPLQHGPEPYYCSFVVNTPDDFASEVSVTVVTDTFEEAQAVAPYTLDWTMATNYESGSCALASTFFQQTQPASLLQPATILGTMPPSPGDPVRICEPTTFNFQAIYGPFSDQQCGNKEALLYAGVSVQGLQNLTTDISMTQITVAGCPSALPLLKMGTVSAVKVTAAYDWSIERTMRPLGTAADPPVVSVAAANARSAATKVLQLSSSPGGVTLFNQTVTFRRSKLDAQPGQGTRYQLKGSVTIMKPDKEPAQIKEIQVKLTPLEDSVGKPVVVKASCPANLLKPAALPARGTVLSIPTSATAGNAQHLSCAFTASVLGSSEVKVVASALMSDGSWATVNNPLTVDLTTAKPASLGGCVNISESQVLTDMGTNNIAAEQAVLVGGKVPATAEQLCFTKTYQTIGQIGPLQSVTPSGIGDCGAVVYNSTVTALPTTGSKGKLTSDGSIVVSIIGC